MSSHDDASLRAKLARVDASQDAIHAAAGAMMKHYDSTAVTAVNEWRNSVRAARQDQLLPLVYVINEVLQTSKRNRGKSFLAAVWPFLGPSLVYVCSNDPENVERVRRTVKIWGDRQIISVRSVQELLGGLEQFRKKEGQVLPKPQAQFSPLQQTSPIQDEAVQLAQRAREQRQEAHQRDEIEDLMDQVATSHDHVADDESGDDDDIFGDLDRSQSQQLKVEINIDSAVLRRESREGNGNKKNKRRRSSMASMGSHSSRSKKQKRRSVLSNSNLMDVWNRLVTLKQSYETAKMTIDKVNSQIKQNPDEELSNMVGDELSQEFAQIQRFQKQLSAQHKSLHAIANEIHAVEQEALRYLPWMETSLQQDAEDIEFCNDLEIKLAAFAKLHPALKQARDIRRAEEAKKQAEEEAKKRAQKEAEESEEFRKAAFKKETEEKPGMRWNPVTREYQTIDTNETWRE